MEKCNAYKTITNDSCNKPNNKQMTLVTDPVLKKRCAEIEEAKLNTNNFI